MSNLSFPAKWLAVFMAHHENRKGEVITTVADIRGWTGLSKAAIRDGINELIHAAFISDVQPFKPGPHSSAKFALTWGDTPQGSASLTEIRHTVAQLVSDDAAKAPEPRVGAHVVMSLSSPSSSDVLSSPVLEKDEELTRESVTETHATSTLNGNCPEWASELITLAAFNRRGLTPKDIADTERDFGGAALAVEARSFVAWYSDGKKKLQRPMAAWRNWLRNARRFETPAGDPLDAYRKSYGRYLRKALD
jgi:hypothetical protein